jgi:hypothetical protein
MADVVYFLGSRRSPSRLFDSQGLIGEFTNRGGTTSRQGDGTLVRNDDQVWIMEISIEDKERLERVKNYPGYGVKFRQITHVPLTGGKKNIHTGASNLDQIKQEAKAEQEALYKEKLEKFKKFYSLEAKLLDKDGKPNKKADPEQLKEMETLKTELEIE